MVKEGVLHQGPRRGVCVCVLCILAVSTSVKSSWGGQTKTKAGKSEHPTDDLGSHVRVVRHSLGETRG